MIASLDASRLTSLPPGVRVGNQEPRLKVVPPYVRSYGLEVIDLMAEVGYPQDPWQALLQIDAHGVQEDNLWAAFETVVLLARQNGKGGFTEGLELGGLFLFKEPRILHSAHQFKTSTAAFNRIIEIIDSSDWLRRRVKTVSRSKGDEGIELTAAAGGGKLQFVARTNGSGRGLTGSTNVFDEAAYLTVSQYAAQTPTLSSIPNPRIVYTATPPDEDVGPMPEDAMLPSVRKRGQAGDDRVMYAEWSPDKDDDRTSEETMYKCNPAAGIRIGLWFLKKQLKNFTEAGKPEKFATEHLGEWPDDPDAQWTLFSKDLWKDREDGSSKVDGGLAIGLSMTPDRARTHIAIFGRRADGQRHTQLIHSGPGGKGWAVKVVQSAMLDAERAVCAVVIGRQDPASSLLPEFAEAEIEVLRPGTADVAAECGSVFDGLSGKDPEQRDLWHTGQEPLTASAAAAVKKKVGNVWLWDPTNLAAPLYAVTAASYGFRVRPPDDYDVADSLH